MTIVRVSAITLVSLPPYILENLTLGYVWFCILHNCFNLPCPLQVYPTLIPRLSSQLADRNGVSLLDLLHLPHRTTIWWQCSCVLNLKFLLLIKHFLDHCQSRFKSLKRNELKTERTKLQSEIVASTCYQRSFHLRYLPKFYKIALNVIVVLTISLHMVR